MPRIAKRYLQCVGYIYPDKESAQSDKPHGGSGFIVARQVDGGIQTFVITNLHVIDKLPNPVIRLNRVTLEPELFLTNRARWIAHPEGDDLAAYQLDVSPDDYK